MRFPVLRQLDQMDCGPTCLKMIAEFFGKKFSLDYLREICFINRQGVNLLSLSDACETLGFETIAARLTIEELAEQCSLPCILHWNEDHYVVLYDVKNVNSFFSGGDKPKRRFYVADPAHGKVVLNEELFSKFWLSDSDHSGVTLILEPTDKFINNDVKENRTNIFSFVSNYLKPYKRYVVQLVIGMIAASVISLFFPILTQLLVDYGIKDKNIDIIYLILASQLFLFFGSTAIDMIQSWLLLHINIRVSLSIISDFLAKLLKLPIRFFDSKAVGDISQRINDHHRIENFLTGSALTSLFSLINILIFTVVLAFYDLKIMLFFLAFSILAVLWIFLFQKERKKIDYKQFSANKENQDKLYELIFGMQEVKLYGSEESKRKGWEDTQVKLFKLNINGLKLEQMQKGGFVFLSQLKNIIISFIAAKGVMEGDFSLGVLLSISYIIGQTNSPLEQLVSYIKASQDAKLSMARMQEIHNRKNEEIAVPAANPAEAGKTQDFGDIVFNNVSFQYHGPRSSYVLKDISFTIPKGKITAIVGTSGSGKTTLMKLLLKFYEPVAGHIQLGEEAFSALSPSLWRSVCGTVMQDGYIFSDSIEKNIALDGLAIDYEKLDHSVKMANIKDYIFTLPLNYKTKIGSAGIGMSGGQKQRMYIARAVYKNPLFLFFDEATSSLDANNEKIISDNLSSFFVNRTVVVIAHRLSTVKSADQIIVMDEGRIVEQGKHDELLKYKGHYFNLVKNQLELGE